MTDDLACRDVVELLTSYLEGVLDESTEAAVEQHLAICSGCETYLEQLRYVAAAIGESERAEAAQSEVAELSEQTVEELTRAFRATFQQPNSS